MKHVPKVTFLPAGVSIEFRRGQLSYMGHGRPGSLLDLALHCGADIEHACGGYCACTSCHVMVRRGAKNLSAMDESEADRLDTAMGVTPNSRLACQAVVRGEVVVEIPGCEQNHTRGGRRSPQRSPNS